MNQSRLSPPSGPPQRSVSSPRSSGSASTTGSSGGVAWIVLSAVGGMIGLVLIGGLTVFLLTRSNKDTDARSQNASARRMSVHLPEQAAPAPTLAAREAAEAERLRRQRDEEARQEDARARREMEMAAEAAAYQSAISGGKIECEQYLAAYGSSRQAPTVRTRLKSFLDREREVWIVESLRGNVMDKAASIQKAFHTLSTFDSCAYEGSAKLGDSHVLRFVNHWTTHWDKKAMTTHFTVSADADGNVTNITPTSCSYTLSECGMTAAMISELAEEISKSR